MSYLRSGEDGNPGIVPKHRSKTEIADRQREALELTAQKYRMPLKTDEDRLKATRKAIEIDPSLMLGEESRIPYKAKLRLKEELEDAQRARLAREEQERKTNEEQCKLAGEQFEELWHDSLNSVGLVHDMTCNEQNPQVLAQHRAAVENLRDTLCPILYKRLGK